ncbi:MAG TPA: phosphoglycerate mutase [Rhodoferax sp.]|nr:phosphoglycerate mutase [Rhodoferax sp.]
MHLLIPYSASHSEGCQSVLPALKLPHLQKLLPSLAAQPLDVGDELSWSPPHERALAAALGLTPLDGQIPWAALQAQKHPELAGLTGEWAFVTLCHWQASMHEVTLRQLPMQDLGAAESDAFLNAMQPFFAQDGITLYPDEPGRWLAQGDVFKGLRSASPDRVLGRNLAPWMPTAAQAASLIRLMSEMQMLLYTHALNDAREARGALTVNAIWISGTGALADPIHTPLPATVAPTLREAALREDWATWASAWQALDALEIKALLEAHHRGEAVQLTLCGERHAQTWQARPRTLMQKIRPFFGSPPVHSRLEQL